MLNKVKEEKNRIVKMYMDSFGINYLHRSNPWAAAWWSAALPGFGHLYLGSHLKGILFMTGEIAINTVAKLNLAIFYTFIGNFQKANDIFSERWGMFYITVWVFSILDSYMIANEMNKLCELEEAQEIRCFKRFKISTLNINSINQKQPWIAVLYSAISGGGGQIYNFQFIKGFFLLAWTVIINYFSQFWHLLTKTLLGKEIFIEQVNWQWLLFYPSIIGFCIWDSYVGAVEINKLLVEEQRYILGDKKEFITVNEGRKFPMFLVGTCKQSVDLELIVSTLKNHGLKKYRIVFLDRQNNDKRKTGDSIRKSDGISNFNGAMAGATILMLFGTIYGGPIIPGGPIVVGLAGFLIGGIVGYLLDRYFAGWIRAKWKLDSIKGSNPVDGEVLLIVKALDEKQHKYISTLFAEKDVRFVGKINDDDMVELFN